MIEPFLMKVRPAFLASFVERLLRIKVRKVSTTYGQFEVDPVSFFGRACIVDGEYEGRDSCLLLLVNTRGHYWL